MNALIENTLNIVAKFSASKKGFLLELNDQGYNILTIWGAQAKEFSSLNKALHKLYKSKEIDTYHMASIPSISKELKAHSFSAFYMKELLIISERNISIFILLFSGNKGEFEGENEKRILSILSVLSRQIKDWIEQPVSVTKLFSERVSIKEDKSLNEWEERFNLILTTSPDIIFILDKSGKISLLNDSGLEFFEYPAEEINGKYFFELVDKVDIPVVTSALNLTLLEKKKVKMEAKLCSKTGNASLYELNFNKIKNNGKVSGLLGIGRNLAERNHYEDELRRLKPKLTELNRLLALERARVEPQKSVIEELNRLKYEFISGLSHEFRSTLASIIGFSETIESDPELPDSMKKEFNRIIMSEGKRLAKLINYLLESTGVEDRFVIINKSNVEITKLVQGVINKNSQFALIKKIDLSFDHPDKEIYIEADGENLKAAIDALLNNAIRFTGESGRVKVMLNNFINEVEITISDTGIGIAESDQPYLFQRFFSLSRRMSDVPSIGVGLVFVKQIVDSHKGLITVHSDVGSGTTFTVKLPKRSKIEKNEVKIE